MTDFEFYLISGCKFSDCRLGYVEPMNDRMYCVDDFGDLIPVAFCLEYDWFQEH